MGGNVHDGQTDEAEVSALEIVSVFYFLFLLLFRKYAALQVIMQ